MDFSQFFSDVAATLIGAFLAVLSAMWLDRRSQKHADARLEQEKQERSKLVLSVIKNELLFDQNALKVIDDNVPSTYRQLQIEGWQAMSDGGELKPINEPKLLATISTAYANIRHFIFLYDKYFNMTFFPENNAYQSLKNPLQNHTLKARDDSRKAVDDAIKAIDKRHPDLAEKAMD